MTLDTPTPGAHRRSDPYRRADGQLTAYALGCGYCQTFAVDGATDYYGTTADAVTLRRDGCYHVHVRAGSLTHDERGAARRVDGDRVDWYTFDDLADARRFYARVRRALRTGAPLTLDALRKLARPVDLSRLTSIG
ncbi:hypothetical protein KNU78_gp86 [Gordonia phage Sukkupi]|uniref:Uncharacterized protein n=1 Tax=Gordonia phage Sukkupi TaxID=2653747 RepID=A0A5Q2WP25_9CAUD|nr:hypothetical protein KNU78_gp86 [Gordonia phage Sukkupi]QGH79329.1 hypothetical protein SEA_SUKKUPI_86 [Gordonia phage Sukkupi]QGH80801.1 hypothetical protein SEA_YNDEXA_86 [Gordonia phage Yndexa]